MRIYGRNLDRNKGSDCLDVRGPNSKYKKYKDPVGRSRREMLGSSIRYGSIFCAWSMLIFFAVQVDNEYLSQCKGCFSGLVHRFVVLGHEWGISHDFLYDTLGGYSSVLLTVVGMIVTGWLSLSDRLEKKVYGIRRKELFGRNWLGRWLVDSFIGVFTTPAWMMYALIRKYCFTAYFIMVLIFVQFLVSNLLLAMTYSRGGDLRRLIKKIKRSGTKSKGATGFETFGELLDRIEASLEENTDWNEVNALFLSCVRKVGRKKGEQKLYRISRDFVTRVYAKRNEDRIVDLAVLYIKEVDKGFEAGGEKGTKLVYWALLDSLYQNCEEEQIASYLGRLTDMLSLNDGLYGIEVNFPVVWIEEIFAMVAVQTEYWLQKNNSRLRCFGETFGKIIQMGEMAYVDEGRGKLLLEFIDVRQFALREVDGTLRQCFFVLRDRYLKAETPDHLDSLLWGIWELQQ